MVYKVPPFPGCALILCLRLGVFASLLWSSFALRIVSVYFFLSSCIVFSVLYIFVSFYLFQHIWVSGVRMLACRIQYDGIALRRLPPFYCILGVIAMYEYCSVSGSYFCDHRACVSIINNRMKNQHGHGVCCMSCRRVETTVSCLSLIHI